MARTPDFDRYVSACDYPGTIAPPVVTERLREYLQALGVQREVRQLPVDWSLASEAPLRRSIVTVLLDFAKRSDRRAAGAALDAGAARAALDAGDARAARAALDALDALDARDARDAGAALDARDALDARAARAALDALDARDARAARDARDALAARDAVKRGQALHRFASWCLHRGWSWWSWDLSWIVTTLLGAQQRGTEILWARPLFEAYIAGAWFLFWTEDTLYWIAKPVVHVEHLDTFRRMHCEDGPALESDAENLYFWHGVLVPAFVVVRPDWITLEHIRREENVEVRRVLLERFGFDRYIRESGAVPIHADDVGTLYRMTLPGEDDPLVVVSVLNSTAEADGSRKQYVLRVEPELRPLPPGTWTSEQKRAWLDEQRPQALTARNAVASLHGLRGEHYSPVIET